MDRMANDLRQRGQVPAILMSRQAVPQEQGHAFEALDVMPFGMR